ncbi:MAG: hypothetical protein COW03_03315 [Cytophagales bacterium CG12_big_fil_rev_8_21_14_0_65_40_12]|nr:MAG: hypothetical protein COW03_03315 [Cytophagales bacterium CG12_big_fil_rev_8_21_14_0_65_40_12]PIW04283.1 MAG: hypothetical protein COW40_10485 [Cytophagales bacterium CG17_big_fil_post_rev_8_21_14_2_50_40_13]
MATNEKMKMKLRNLMHVEKFKPTLDPCSNLEWARITKFPLSSLSKKVLSHRLKNKFLSPIPDLN